jgi:hypothetical protein
MDGSEHQVKSDGGLLSGRNVLKAIGLGMGIGSLLGLLTGFGFRPFIPLLKDTDWLATIITTEVYLSLIAGQLLVFKGLKGLRFHLSVKRPTWTEVGLALIVWAGIWVIAFFVYELLYTVWTPIQEMGAAIIKIGALYGRLENASLTLRVVAIVQPVLITPIAEELIFRGSLFGWLRAKKSATTTILITSALFAFYHPLIWLWPMALLFGLGAGWIREHTQSIVPFLIAHMLNSAAMITFSYVTVGWHVKQIFLFAI